MAQTKKFPTDELVLDERCQARADVDHDAVTEYRDAYAAGTELPDPKVFMVSGKAYVVDGYHRVPAAILAKKRWLRCEVVGEGTLDDAVWYAAAVNQTHGVRRTNADKRRAVRLALETPIGQEQSSAEIARHVGVSDKLVTLVREEVERELRDSRGSGHVDQPRNSEVATRVGKDGKRRPARQPRARTVVEPEPDAGHPCDGVPEIVEERDPFEGVPALADTAADQGAPALAQSIPPVGEKLLAAAAEIKRARHACRKLLGEELNAYAQRTEEALRGAEYALRYAVPEVCPGCGGEGCKRCTGRGWVDRSTAEQMRASAKVLGRETAA